MLGDIGTHPLYLSEVMLPDLKIKRLMCARQSFVKSRAPLEDNAFTLMEYDTGAVGHRLVECRQRGLRCTARRSASSAPRPASNGGTSTPTSSPTRCRAAGRSSWIAAWATCTRRPWPRTGSAAGHPEGLFEAWSNLYYRFAMAMDATDRGDKALLATIHYPDVHAGVEGVRWVENCVRSADQAACGSTMCESVAAGAAACQGDLTYSNEGGL